MRRSRRVPRLGTIQFIATHTVTLGLPDWCRLEEIGIKLGRTAFKEDNQAVLCTAVRSTRPT
jgi:hypothetical protein